MKTNPSKKEIRHNLETALITEIEKMEGPGSSKKLKRAVRKFSKDLAPKVKLGIKKKIRKGMKGFNIQKENEFSGSLMETAGEKIENGHA